MKTITKFFANDAQLTSYIRWLGASLGFYLLFQWLELAPYRHELFGEGLLRGLPVDIFRPLVPGWGGVPPSDWAVSLIFFLRAIFLLCFALGFKPRFSAAISWLLALPFGIRNPMILHIGSDYVGFLLLCYAVMPRSVRGIRQVSLVACFVLFFTYTLSGFAKLSSEEWRAGHALEMILRGPTGLSSDFNSALLSRAKMLSLLTWMTLILEAGAMLSFVTPVLGIAFWIGLTGMQCGIMSMTQMTELSIGILLFHLFALPAIFSRDHLFRRAENEIPSS